MKNTYLFSSNAILRSGTDIYETYKYVTVVAEIDFNSGEIIDCDFPTYCRNTSEFVADIMKGKSITQVDSIIKEIDTRMHTLSKRALITAIQGLYNRYLIVKKQKEGKNE